jgi:hypothetical protein
VAHGYCPGSAKLFAAAQIDLVVAEMVVALDDAFENVCCVS